MIGSESLSCPACAGPGTAHAHPQGLLYQRCTACGCVFRDFRTGPDYGASQSGYRNTTGKVPTPDPRSSRRARIGYEHVEALLVQAGAHRQSRVLDVGAGAGYLLDHLQHQGWTQVSGVEPNVATDDPRIFRHTLEGLIAAAPDRSFDFIVLNQVIEHLEHPAQTLAHALQLLSPQGRVVITTPNVRTWDKWLRHRLSACKLSRNPWNYLDAPKHVVLFTPTALRALAKRAQGDIAHVGTWTRPLGIGNRLVGPIRDRMGIGAHCFAIFKR